MRETEPYQRAVTAKIEDGWQIEEETSDRVTLVKRNIGSLTVHLILALFTLWWAMGVPNLLYAAYKYFTDAERTIIWKESSEAGNGT